MARIAIFGATSAIATSCARLWLSEGSSLFLVARNPDKLQVLVDTSAYERDQRRC